MKAELKNKVLQECRLWLTEHVHDESDVLSFSDSELIRLIDNYFDGGIKEFRRCVYRMNIYNYRH